MIYHYATQTAIFTPAKCGSSSLREIAYSRRSEFLVCTGPAPDNKRNVTHHTSSSSIDAISGMAINQRALLFREPESRVLSLWKHTYNDHQKPFSLWLRGIEPNGLYSPMTSYCERPFRYVRMRSMAADLSRLFGSSFERVHVNESVMDDPIVTTADRDLMKEMYAADFAKYAEITAQTAGLC